MEFIAIIAFMARIDVAKNVSAADKDKTFFIHLAIYFLTEGGSLFGSAEPIFAGIAVVSH